MEWTSYAIIVAGIYLAFGLFRAVDNSLWMMQNVKGVITQEEFLNAFFIVTLCWPVFINHRFYMEFKDEDENG